MRNQSNDLPLKRGANRRRTVVDVPDEARHGKMDVSSGRRPQGYFVALVASLLLIFACLLAGTLNPFDLKSLSNGLLIAIASGTSGCLLGFLASNIASDNKLVSRAAESLTAALSGASITAAAIRGKDVLDWLSPELGIPKAQILLTVITASITGFLVMYLYRQLMLNVLIAQSRRRIDTIQSKAISTMLGKEGDAVELLNLRKPGTLPPEVRHAVRELTQGVEMTSLQTFETFYSQAIALIVDDKSDLALTVLDKAKIISPHDYRVYIGLASAYLKLNKPTLATECLSRAENYTPDPPSADILRLYGDHWTELKDYDKACNYYLRYLAMRPQDARARLALASLVMLRAKGRSYVGSSALQETHDEALEHLEQVIRADPNLKQEAIHLSGDGGPLAPLARNERFIILTRLQGSD